MKRVMLLCTLTLLVLMPSFGCLSLTYHKEEWHGQRRESQFGLLGLWELDGGYVGGLIPLYRSESELPPEEALPKQ